MSLDCDSPTSCKDRGHVKHHVYESNMQKIKLKVNLETKEVQNPYRIPFPCTVLGTRRRVRIKTLDAYAYRWDMPENSEVTKLRSHKAKMVKYANKLEYSQYQY